MSFIALTDVKVIRILGQALSVLNKDINAMQQRRGSIIFSPE